MNRRQFLAASTTVALGSMVSGCKGLFLTSELIRQVNESERHDYTETVDHILMTVDGRKLVFVGPKYHYVFDAPEHLQKILNSPLLAKMTAEFDDRFNVDVDSNVKGWITLKIKNPSQDDLVLMAACEFSAAGIKTILLQGIRYSAGDFKMPSRIQPLNESYQVTVRETIPAWNGKKVLLLLAPLTVLADGMIWLIGVLALMVMLTMMSPGK
jgi:hypothetical protein